MKDKKIKYIPCSWEDEIKEEHLQFKPFDNHINKTKWSSFVRESNKEKEEKIVHCKLYVVLDKENKPAVLYPISKFVLSKLIYAGFKNYDDCLQFYIDNLQKSNIKVVELPFVYRIEFIPFNYKVLNLNIKSLIQNKDNIHELYFSEQKQAKERIQIYKEKQKQLNKIISENNKLEREERRKLKLELKEKEKEERRKRKEIKYLQLKEQKKEIKKKFCKHCNSEIKLKEGESITRLFPRKYCSHNCFVQDKKQNRKPKKIKPLTERQKVILQNKLLIQEGKADLILKERKEKVKQQLNNLPEEVKEQRKEQRRKYKQLYYWKHKEEIDKRRKEKAKQAKLIREENKRLKKIALLEKLPKKFCLFCNKQIFKKDSEKLSYWKKIVYCSKECSSKAHTRKDREERKKKIEQVRQAFKNWDLEAN